MGHLGQMLVHRKMDEDAAARKKRGINVTFAARMKKSTFFLCRFQQFPLISAVLPVVSVPTSSGHPTPDSVSETGSGSAAALVCWTGTLSSLIITTKCC